MVEFHFPTDMNTFLRDMPIVKPHFNVNKEAKESFDKASEYFRSKASELLTQKKKKGTSGYMNEYLEFIENFSLYVYICELSDFCSTNTYVRNNRRLSPMIIYIIESVKYFSDENRSYIDGLKVNVTTLDSWFIAECDSLIKDIKELQREPQMKKYENLYSSFIFKEISVFKSNKYIGNYYSNLWMLNYYNFLNELKAKMLFDKESLKNSNLNFFIGIAGFIIGIIGLLPNFEEYILKIFQNIWWAFLF